MFHSVPYGPNFGDACDCSSYIGHGFLGSARSCQWRSPQWRSRPAGCWLTLTSFASSWALPRRMRRRGSARRWTSPQPQAVRRLDRPTLRGTLLGKEIGTSQSIPPVGVGRFRATPHIALSGAFLALSAPDFNRWPRRWVRDNGAIGTPEEPQRGDLQGAPSGCHQQCIVAEGKT